MPTNRQEAERLADEAVKDSQDGMVDFEVAKVKALAAITHALLALAAES